MLRNIAGKRSVGGVCGVLSCSLVVFPLFTVIQSFGSRVACLHAYFPVCGLVGFEFDVFELVLAEV